MLKIPLSRRFLKVQLKLDDMATSFYIFNCFGLNVKVNSNRTLRKSVLVIKGTSFKEESFS